MFCRSLVYTYNANTHILTQLIQLYIYNMLQKYEIFLGVKSGKILKLRFLNIF